MAQDFESTFAYKIQSGSFTTLLTSDSDDADNYFIHES